VIETTSSLLNSREQTCSRWAARRLNYRLATGPVWSRLLGVAIVAIMAPALGQLPAKSQLVLLDGAVVPFQSLEINAGKLSGEGVPADLTLDDLRRIDLASSSPAPLQKAFAIIDLRANGRIMATGVTIANEKCRIEWSGGEPLSLPVDLMRAIRFEPAAANTEFDKAVAAPSAELDRVFVKDDAGQLNSVSGLIDSLDGEQVKVEIGGQERRIPRAKLFGIAFAQAAAHDSPAHCAVTFRDGSALGGETISLSNGKAILTLAAGEKVEFLSAVASRVIIRSNRVAFLSDLKPVAETQQPIVTLPMPAARDKSVSGRPLKLGARVYEKGLGVHARSSLTFAADKKWDTLAATIGLDAAAEGRGDCVFVVLADGEPLFTRRLKGADAPEEIQLPIAGREQVTLLVEPGQGLDLADHADWCDARFIKNK